MPMRNGEYRSPYEAMDMDGVTPWSADQLVNNANDEESLMPAVMQPTGNEVSREAYDDVTRSGRANAQQQRVIDALGVIGPSTRQQLADHTGLRLQTICPRCRELLDADLIEVVDTVGKPASQVLGLSEGEDAH